MARLLMFSSWVAEGHVGLSAAVPVLQALGHRVTQLPSTVLSNHPGWPHVAGAPVSPDSLRSMIRALEKNGWLQGYDAFLTGYLPTAGHVALACETVERLRRQEMPPRIVIDPVLGDAPKGLYLPEPVADAVRDKLVPLADTLTPNRFELGWLTGAPITTLDAARQAAEVLRLQNGAREVLLTSPPAAPGKTGVLAVGPAGVAQCTAPLREGVPHGVGDVFSALIAAGLTVGAALGHLQALVEASLGADHLRIVEAAAVWTAAPPLPQSSLSAEAES